MLQAIFMAKCHLSRNKKVLHYWRLLEQSIEVLLKFQVFICYLAAAVSLLETNNTKDFITGLPTYYQDMSCLDGLYLKNCVLLTAFWDQISTSNVLFGPNGAPLSTL